MERGNRWSAGELLHCGCYEWTDVRLTDVFEGFAQFAELSEALLHHAGRPLTDTLVLVAAAPDHALERLKHETSVKPSLSPDHSDKTSKISEIISHQTNIMLFDHHNSDIKHRKKSIMRWSQNSDLNWIIVTNWNDDILCRNWQKVKIKTWSINSELKSSHNYYS